MGSCDSTLFWRHERTKLGNVWLSTPHQDVPAQCPASQDYVALLACIGFVVVPRGQVGALRNNARVTSGESRDVRHSELSVHTRGVRTCCLWLSFRGCQRSLCGRVAYGLTRSSKKHDHFLSWPPYISLQRFASPCISGFFLVAYSGCCVPAATRQGNIKQV